MLKRLETRAKRTTTGTTRVAAHGTGTFERTERESVEMPDM